MNNNEIICEKYREAATGIKEDWLNADTSKWFDYVISLPLQLQITYLIVILDTQIINGGFHQYFVNGYGQFAKETIMALIEIGAFKKAELLKEALLKVNNENLNDEQFRKKLLLKGIIDLFKNDSLFEPLDKLDNAYYENEEEIEQLLGSYLNTHQNGN